MFHMKKYLILLILLQTSRMESRELGPKAIEAWESIFKKYNETVLQLNKNNMNGLEEVQSKYDLSPSLVTKVKLREKVKLPLLSYDENKRQVVIYNQDDLSLIGFVPIEVFVEGISKMKKSDVRAKSEMSANALNIFIDTFLQ